MPWLIFPPFPDDKAMMSPDEKRVFEHYDKLLFMPLCDIVEGSQLETIILAESSGAEALKAFIKKNESTHARASINLLLELIMMVYWDQVTTVEPRIIVAKMNNIHGRVHNLVTPITLPAEIFQAILLARSILKA